MIYAALAVYLLGILFMAMGVYRLWAGMVNPRWVGWALLPGTVVSEMAYIFGCLITGGEIHRARLMGPARAGQGNKAAKAGAEPTTEATPRIPHLGPVIEAFAAIVACGAAILAAHALLGGPVIDRFGIVSDQLHRALPTSTAGFWQQVHRQVHLVRHMGRTLLALDWLDWRVPVFVYLAACLSIRLAPVHRPVRASLAAVVALAGIIALVGLAWWRFSGLVGRIWPLVSYVWASLLFLLALSLIIRGCVGLVRALAARETARGAG
ncbi:MAG: hypothetical protein B1H04_04855 [Planctomycetales bacterium 4484_123]|nr:MAG: hypothetical protein B1H04_04855 [Planctomycetales bacterium 4484_123]